jgi:hypothetical protein
MIGVASRAVSMQKDPSVPARVLYTIAASLIVTLHFSLIANYSWNVPDWDDYDMLLAPLLQWLNATPTPLAEARDFTHALLQLHNEHLVAVERLIPILWYMLFGNINYQGFIILGNCCFFVGLVALYRSCRFQSPSVFLILCFIMLQPQYRQSTVWATGSLQNLIALSFAFLAFTCLVRNTPQKTLAAVVLCLFAVATQANGIFCLPTIAFVFLLQRRRKLAAALAAFGLAVALWHVSRLPIASGGSLFLNLSDRLLYFCIFLGSFTQNFVLSILAGALFSLGFLWLTYRKQYATNPQLYALILFIILSAAANSLSRLQFGIDYPIKEGRYQLLSLTLLASFWLLLLKSYETKILLARISTGVAAVFFCYSYYFSFNWLRQHTQRVEEGVARWQIAGTDLEYSSHDRASPLLLKSIELKLYEMPVLELGPLLAAPVATRLSQVSQGSIISQIEHVVVGKEYLLISGWAFPANPVASEWTTKVVLNDATKSLAFVPSTRIRPEVSRHHRTPGLDRSGFLLVAKTSDIESLSGQAIRINLLIEQEGSPAIRKTESKTISAVTSD